MCGCVQRLSCSHAHGDGTGKFDLGSNGYFRKLRSRFDGTPLVLVQIEAARKVFIDSHPLARDKEQLALAKGKGRAGHAALGVLLAPLALFARP